MSSILLNIFITPFAEQGAREAEKWTTDAAKEALAEVNSIWKKADIAFAINDCVIDRPLDMAKSARNNDQRLLDVLSSRHQPDNLVHIFLVNPIVDLAAGGCSYVDSNPEPASFVQWYGTGGAGGRPWAHELGHLLGLDHIEINYSDEKQAAALRNNLMTKGLSVGRDLTVRQIDKATRSRLLKRVAR